MGCTKQSKPTSPADAPSAVQDSKPAPAAVAPAVLVEKPSVKVKGKMTKIYIITYSMYGHINTMAKALKDGIDSVEGCEGVLYQVPETLSEEVLAKMHAPPKPDLPIIKAADLPAADGLVFGFPTRFGMMCAQMKAFFDTTGQLWQSGGLVGKPCTMFTSTASQGGGQETTLLTAITQVAAHGMIYVAPGYGAGAVMFSNDEARGGSGYGAGCLANGDGSRQPSDAELSIATYQGKYFAGKAKLLSA